MRKIYLLMFALMLCFSMANAQVIEGTVLKSWDGASGSIEIPANVTEIADNCFYSPAEEDPDTWEVIGEEKSNTNITNIKLNNVKKIGKNAFKGCSNIESIDAPNVEIVGDEAFARCEKLATLDLPNIKNVGVDAFQGCEQLKEIALGKSLTTISGSSFKNCKSLTTISIEDGGGYKALQNAIISPNKTLVYIAGQAKEIKLTADECTAIGDYAMYNNTNIAK